MEKRTVDTPMMSLLLSLPLFQGLTLDQLMHILEKAPLDFINLSDGRFVRQGERHDKVSFILKGRVERVLTNQQAAYTFAETMEETDIIELCSLFGRNALYGADYWAKGEVTLLSFDKRYLFTVLNHFDIVQLNLLNLFSARSQSLQQRLLEVSGHSLIGQFCHFINKISDIPRGRKELEMTRVDLANLLDCSRRRMSEEIVSWEKKGLIEVSYGRLVIPDLRQFTLAVMKNEGSPSQTLLKEGL